MSISLNKSNQLKTIAILMMLGLHLFNREYHNLFQPLIFVGQQPLSYYLSLFCDACVPIFAFVSGYGLYYKYQTSKDSYTKGNFVRLKKLYINLCVIIVLFAVLLGLAVHDSGNPGSLVKFLLNVTGIETSYNSAWWFFTTYVFFVLSSSFWFRILEKYNPYVFIVVLLLVYFVAFYLRVYQGGLFENRIIAWLYRQAFLYFCTLFQFMLGAFALKFDWNKKVSIFFKNIKFKNAVLLVLIGGLIVLHGLLPNFIIAPFTGLAFIFLFLQLDLPKLIDGVLGFISPHATNIWLIHMFFYMIYFPEFIYSFRYVPIIYLVLLGLCMLSSYVVNVIIKQVIKLI